MEVKQRNNIVIIFVAFAIFFFIVTDYISIKPVSEQRVLMDTNVEITLYGFGRDRKKLRNAIEAGFKEMARIEQLMSSFIPASEISRINSSGGNEIAVSKETIGIIEVAKQVSELTGGAFDITVGRLMDIWDFTGGKNLVPDDTIIKEALTHTGMDKVITRYDEATGSFYVRLSDPNVKLDLGGIASGYAIKRAAKIISSFNVRSGIIDDGGDILIIGDKNGAPFKIGIKSPNGDGMVGVINARNMSIVTSGDYERYFMKDGVRYHHILDPKTGYPARLCRSVTIMAPDATLADSLSTAIFVMGPKDGLELVNLMDDIEAVIIDNENKMYMSEGVADFLELSETK